MTAFDTRGEGAAAWVPILLYHRVVAVPPRHDPAGNCVDVATFGSHLRWLAKRGYRCVTLPDVGALLGQGATRATRAKRLVAITFDDGYEDTYLQAWPVLRRYGCTATVFLVSDIIGGENEFDARAGYERVRMLGGDQIRELHRAGIAVGSHSCSHPILTTLPDAPLRHEVADSRRAIETILDAPVDLFAYPHSKVDARVEAAVAGAGYRLACAGVGTSFTPLRLHRVAPPVWGGPSVEAVIAWRDLKRRVRQWQRRA